MASFRRERWSLTRIDPLLSTTRTILMAAFSSCAALVVAATAISAARAKIVVERLAEPIGGRPVQGCRLQFMASLLEPGWGYRLVGKRVFSSSIQCWTRMMAASSRTSASTISFNMRNRWPSEAMSYGRGLFTAI